MNLKYAGRVGVEERQGGGSGGSGFLMILLVCIVVVFAYLALAPTVQNTLQITTNIPNYQLHASTHAIETHGEEAITAETCFNGAGSVMSQKYVDPTTNRKMSFCNQHGNWFVSIDECTGENVTCYARKLAKSFSDVKDYAIHNGFFPPH